MVRGQTLQLGWDKELRLARAGEIEMIARKHARLFGRKPEPLLRGLQCVDALEQRVVQIGFAAMARQNRGHLALDRLQFVIGRGAREIGKDPRHSIEAVTAALQRLDGVGEGRDRIVGRTRGGEQLLSAVLADCRAAG